MKNPPYTTLLPLLIAINITFILYMINESSIYFKEAQGFFDHGFFAQSFFAQSFFDHGLFAQKFFSQEFFTREFSAPNFFTQNFFTREFFSSNGLVFSLAHLGVWLVNMIFGDPMLNDFGARLPFVILHVFSCTLLYHIALMILKKPSHSLFCVLIFMLIPGITLQAFLISNAGVITCIALLIIYYQLRFNRILYVAFIFIALLDSGGAILTLALFFYALIYKKHKTIIFAIILFGINMSIFSPIHGIPHTYILDALTSLFLLFSPALFIYYLATIYSFSFHNNHNKPTLLSLVPLIGFIFVFLVSTRQPIQAQSFFPALSVAVPLFIKRTLFMVNARLPQFRFKYKMRIYAVIFFLILGNIVFFGNKITYFFVKEKNFAFSFYGAKEVARELYKRGLTNIYVPDSALAMRLRFYGIMAWSGSWSGVWSGHDYAFVYNRNTSDAGVVRDSGEISRDSRVSHRDSGVSSRDSVLYSRDSKSPVPHRDSNVSPQDFSVPPRNNVPPPPKYKLIESSKGDIKIIYNGVVVTGYEVVGV